jgi:ribosome-associated protein
MARERKPAKATKGTGKPRSNSRTVNPARRAKPSAARKPGKAGKPAARRGAPPGRGKGKGTSARKARPGIKAATIIRRPSSVFPPPAPPAPPAPVAPPDEGQERALAAVAAGLDKKAENPVILDVRGLSGVADYFVVLSADSDRQAAAVADAVDDRVTALGAERLGVEGRGGGGWVLLDFGDVVVHVFSPEMRGFYDLEGLWADAPRVAVKA